MSYLEDIEDREEEERRERIKRNREYFNSRTDEQKLDFLWSEYVNKHYDDYSIPSSSTYYK